MQNDYHCECGAVIDRGTVAPMGVINRHRARNEHFRRLAEVRRAPVRETMCPECGAEPGEKCSTRKGNPARYHAPRCRAALAALDKACTHGVEVTCGRCEPEDHL